MDKRQEENSKNSEEKKVKKQFVDKKVNRKKALRKTELFNHPNKKESRGDFIADESLYESGSSAYDSLFLSRSMEKGKLADNIVTPEEALPLGQENEQHLDAHVQSHGFHEVSEELELEEDVSHIELAQEASEIELAQEVSEIELAQEVSEIELAQEVSEIELPGEDDIPEDSEINIPQESEDEISHDDLDSFADSEASDQGLDTQEESSEEIIIPEDKDPESIEENVSVDEYPQIDIKKKVVEQTQQVEEQKEKKAKIEQQITHRDIPADVLSKRPVTEKEILEEQSAWVMDYSSQDKGKTLKDLLSGENISVNKMKMYFILGGIILVLISIIFMRGFSTTNVITKVDNEVSKQRKILDDSLKVYSKANGQIVKLFCKEGSIIKKGAILAKLNNPEISQNLKIAQHLYNEVLIKHKKSVLLLAGASKRYSNKENLDFLKKFSNDLEKIINDELNNNFEQSANNYKTFFEQNILKMSRAQMNLYKAKIIYNLTLEELKVAKLNLEKLKGKEKDFTIYAPKKGKIVAMFFKEGNVVTYGAKVAAISNP